MEAVCLQGDRICYASNYQSKPRDGMVEVSVLAAGICETDLQLKKGYMGFQGVLGHEFVGVPLAGRLAGQRVTGEINCACGSCDFCRRGLPRHCTGRSVIGILNHDGAFAETLFVPEENFHPVPADLSTDRAVFTEPVAAACRILEQVRIAANDRVVILGDGRLGNLCAQVLKTTKCSLCVVGKHQSKLDRLAALGVDNTLLADFQAASDADFVVDCTGSASGTELAVQAVRACGTIIQKTTVAGTQDLAMAPFVIDEITLLGSRCGPFAPALELLHTEQVVVDDLISGRYPLQEAEAAFEHAEEGDALKILFDITGE